MVRIMRKTLVFLTIFLILCAGLIALAAYFLLPGYLESQLKTAFRDLGFRHVEIGRIEQKGTLYTFSEITLDEDGFSIVGRIQAAFDWPTLIKTQKLNTLSFEDMTLTAILESDGSFSLSGWAPPELKPVIVPVHTINFNGIKLDLDTIHGALRFECKGQALTTPDDSLDIQAAIWGRQAQATIDTRWNASVETNGNWFADMELREGKLELTDIRASRLGGWISLGGTLGGLNKTGGQLLAGSLTIGSLPLQNLTATLDGTPDAYEIILDGHAAGAPGLTFQSSFGKNENGVFGHGIVRSSRSADLISLFRSLGHMDETIISSYLGLLPPATMEVTYKPEEGANRWNHVFDIVAQDQSKGLVIKSRLDLDLQKKAVHGSLNVKPTDVRALSRVIPIDKLTGFTAREGNLFASGRYVVDLNSKDPAIEGPLVINLNDIGIENETASVTGLNGEIEFSSLRPLATKGAQKLTSKTIEAGATLENGEILFRVDKTDELFIDGATFDFDESRLSIAPISFRQNKPLAPLRIELSGMDLQRLAERLGSKDFRMSGLLDGTLQILFDENNVVIQEGTLKNRAPGFIKYAPEKYPKFLAGTDTRMQTVRDALKQFEYDTLSLNVEGPISGEMHALMEAKGKNPAIFGQRPIHLNLELEGAIPALLTTNR